MPSYEKSIQENMKFMNSNLSEWSALEISGWITDKEGRKLPEYKFPTGYNPAKSLYSNNGGFSDNMQCELCGHNIKTAFYIKNDSKKQLLMVGSECVTHFGEKNGNELLNIAKKEEIEMRITTLKELRIKYYKKYTYVDAYKKRRFTSNAPKINQYKDVKWLLAKVCIEPTEQREKSAAAVITKWYNNYYEECSKFFNSLDCL